MFLMNLSKINNLDQTAFKGTSQNDRSSQMLSTKYSLLQMVREVAECSRWIRVVQRKGSFNQKPPLFYVAIWSRPEISGANTSTDINMMNMASTSPPY